MSSSSSPSPSGLKNVCLLPEDVNVETELVCYTDSSANYEREEVSTMPVAHFASQENSVYGGKLLDVNSDYIIYPVKNFLIRVIGRQSALRTLLRGHTSAITDLSFFPSNPIVGTCGGNTAIIWRITQNASGDELVADQLLRLTSEKSQIQRILWHPKNPNRFALLFSNSQCNLLDTTQLQTTAGDGSTCPTCHNVDTCGIMIQPLEQGKICNASWNGQYLLTCHTNGTFAIYNTTTPTTPTCIYQSTQNTSSTVPMSHAMMISENEFFTCQGSTFSLWNFSSSSTTPTLQKSLKLLTDDSNVKYQLLYCQKMLWIGNNINGNYYATNWKQLNHYKTLYPIYSWAQDDNNDDDNFHLFCLQTKAVQVLTVPTSPLTIVPPPSPNTQSPGVVIEKLIKEEETKEEKYQDYEDEDIDDDDYQNVVSDEEEDDAPPASALPPPGFPIQDITNNNKNNEGNNAFSNWLGSLAAANSTSFPPAPAPTPTNIPPPGFHPTSEPTPRSQSVPPSATATTTAAAPFLSPMEFLKQEPKSTTTTTTTKKQFNNNSKTKNHKTPKKTSKQPVPIPSADGKIAILKRDPDSIISSTSVATTAAVAVAATTVESAAIPECNNSNASITNHSVLSKQEMEDIVKKNVSISMKKMESNILSNVQKIVQDQIQKSMTEQLTEEKINQALSNIWYQKDISKELSVSMKEPVIHTFHQTMKDIMIPAFENATKQMFHQISDTLQNGVSQQQQQQNLQLTERMDAMAKTMEVLIQAVAQLNVSTNTYTATQNNNNPNVSTHDGTASIHNVKVSSAQSIPSNESYNSSSASRNSDLQAAAIAAAKAQQQQKDRGIAIRRELQRLIHLRQYEVAFTQALSASDADVALFACQNADLNDVLGGDDVCQLSQPILLCLMQQLGAELVRTDDINVTLRWLQEVAVCLDPNDESIRRHVASVCQQLITNINERMAQRDPAFRRPLQMLLQVIRGIIIIG